MLQYSFTKTHEIDKDKFAELVIAAQGCRSLRSFADACGVYASTLTRIIQKENKGASSPELLEAIAKNADSKSGVTIDVLADANGYSIKYILNQKHNTESSQFVKISKAVIAAALLDRGAVARFENTCRNISAYSICDEYYARPDIHILTDSFECNTTDWLICAVCFSPSHIFDKADMRNIFTKISEFSALSVTSDNGREFAKLSEALDCPVYYCHAYASHERGTNENHNRMIRRHLPKGTKKTTKQVVAYIENWMNNYPRKMFNFKTPNQMLIESI